MKKHGIVITLVPVLLIMALIFAFSAQTGSESGSLSDRLVMWLLGGVWPGFDALSGLQQAQIFEITGFIVRKGAHFTVFATLGFFLLLHIRQIGKKVSVERPGLWAWGIGTAYAVSDELHQLFVSGRNAVRELLKSGRKARIDLKPLLKN